MTQSLSPALQAREVTKSYGQARGIVGVDLRVDAGQVMGLVGANGAGKTTWMRTLLDFIRPTSGSVNGVRPRQRARLGRGTAASDPPSWRAGDAAPVDRRPDAGALHRREADPGPSAGGRSRGPAGPRSVTADRGPVQGQQAEGWADAGLRSTGQTLVLDEPTSGLDLCCNASSRCFWPRRWPKGRRSCCPAM